jgi:hypothetical protein
MVEYSEDPGKNLRSTPLGDLDQVIRLSEGTFPENLSQLAQKPARIPP